MKPARAIAINNDKNNPIRRLFDLSAPIFRARSIRLITILLDLGGEPSRADPCRSPSRRDPREIEFIESHAHRTISAIVISITSHFPSLRRIFFVADRCPIWIIVSRENLVSVCGKFAPTPRFATLNDETTRFLSPVFLSSNTANETHLQSFSYNLVE